MDSLRVLLAMIVGLVRGLWAAMASLVGELRAWLYSVSRIKPGESRRTVIVLIALLAIGISLVIVLRSLHTPRPRVDYRPYQALGAVLAEETAKLIGDQGRVVLIGYATTVPGGGGQVFSVPPSMRIPEESFRRLLARNHPRVTLIAVETVPPGPMRLPESVGLLPANRFLELLDKYRDADALVSLVGAPTLSKDQLDAHPPPTCKVIVAQAFGPEVQRLMERGFVHLATAPQFPPSTNSVPPASTREWFDRYFQLITPQTVNRLTTLAPRAR